MRHLSTSFNIAQHRAQIRAFGLNRMDIYQREGYYPPPAGCSDILGVEFSGTIAQLGTSVPHSVWKEGDEVMGLAGGGAYAEFIVVPHTHILRKPPQLSWAEAASIPECFLTAYQALVVYGEVQANENVLVHAGASGVGLAAIQLARYYGANSVIATASTQDKLDFLTSIPNGATHGVNYKEQDFAAETKKITTKSHWAKNIDAMAMDGRMTMLAMLSGSNAPAFDLRPILFKRLRITGSTLRSRTDAYQSDLIQRLNTDCLNKITGQSGDGPIKTYVHKVYPFNEIQDAHREMEANQNIGKIIAEIL
ncbi:hypothetical protein ONZ45_g15753 [Pleurotus djamor]|nr:hypothetical protein ONZ45_g15753 [Pleurotus djamor]